MNWKIWYSSVYRIYYIILNIYWQVLICVKIFQAKMKLENIEMEFLTHAPSEEQNLRAERLISSTCLIYRRPWRPRLISWPMNVCQESFWILQPVDLLLQVWLGFPLLHSLPLNIDWPNRLICSLVHFVCPELQFLCYSQINSISGHLNLLQFTSFI